MVAATLLTVPPGALAQGQGSTELAFVMSELKKEVGAARNGIVLHTLGGAGRAYAMANAKLHARGYGRLYCPPPTLSLNERNYAEIALTYYEKNKATFGDLWAQQPAFDALVLILGDGLASTFPCR